MRSYVHTFIFIVAAALAIVAYIPGFSGTFLFDDEPVLVDNALMNLELSDFDNWRLGTMSFSTNRPVAMFSFTLERALLGELTPLSSKLVNLLLHLGIGAVIYCFFEQLLPMAKLLRLDDRGAKFAAALGAGIWLLHPLNVATVLYPVQRMTQLSTLFTLLGLAIYVRFRIRWLANLPDIASATAMVLWVSLAGFLAFKSKENGVLLFWLIPLLEFCFFAGRWNGKTLPWARHIAALILLLPLLVVSSYFALGGGDWIIDGYAVRDFTLSERVLTQTRVMWTYLGWIVFPNILDMGFQHDYIRLSSGLLAPFSTLASLIAWLVVGLGVFLLRDRAPLVCFGVGFFLIGHSIESTIIALEIAYEHRNYLPSVGFCVILGAIVAGVTSGWTKKRALALAVSVFMLLSLLVAIRAYSWGDDLRFTRDNLARHPHSARNNYFYGNALLRQWRMRDQLGLGEEEAIALAAAGRHYMEVMHQIEPSDLGAAIMLYYLDSVMFQSLDTASRWKSQIFELVQDEQQVLTATERNALVLLLQCIGSGECEIQEREVEQLFNSLEMNHARRVNVIELRYMYASAKFGEEAALKLLYERLGGDEIIARNHYPYVIAHALRSGRIAEVHQLVVAWIRADVRHLDIHLQQAIFAR